MNNIVIDRKNFWKILDRLYTIVQDESNNITLHYEVQKTKSTPSRTHTTHSFIRAIEQNPVRFHTDPLSFQKNLRNEW